MSFSDNVIAIIDTISKQFGVVIDWTNANVMPYIEQLCGRIINYELGMAIFGLVIGIIMFLVSIKCWRKTREFIKEDDAMFLVTGIIGGVFLFLSLTGMFWDISSIITAVTLPEKSIIEFFMELK